MTAARKSSGRVPGGGRGSDVAARPPRPGCPPMEARDAGSIVGSRPEELADRERQPGRQRGHVGLPGPGGEVVAASAAGGGELQPDPVADDVGAGGVVAEPLAALAQQGREERRHAREARRSRRSRSARARTRAGRRSGRRRRARCAGRSASLPSDWPRVSVSSVVGKTRKTVIIVPITATADQRRVGLQHRDQEDEDGRRRTAPSWPGTSISPETIREPRLAGGRSSATASPVTRSSVVRVANSWTAMVRTV